MSPSRAAAIARGNLLSIKTEAAREIPGVHAVYTQEDLAPFKVDMLSFYLTPPEVEITPLANGRVAYVGEPVALIIADSRHIAEDAASLVEIEYAEEDPVVTIADARRGPPVHPGTENNIAAQMGDEEIDEDLAAVLKARADPDYSQGRSPAHLAIADGDAWHRCDSRGHRGADALHHLPESALGCALDLARTRPAADRDPRDRQGCRRRLSASRTTRGRRRSRSSSRRLNSAGH